MEIINSEICNDFIILKDNKNKKKKKTLFLY